MAWSGWEMNFLLMGAAVGSPKKPLSDRGEAAAGSGFSRTAGCGSGEPRQGLCPSAGFTGGERGQPSTVSSSSRSWTLTLLLSWAGGAVALFGLPA